MPLEVRRARPCLVLAWIGEPGWRGREHHALAACLESIGVEVVDADAAVRIFPPHEREERLPPQTVVQREAIVRAPRVLRVEADVLLRRAVRAGHRLPHFGHPAEHEVAQGIARVVRRDREAANTPAVRQRDDIVVDHVPPMANWCAPRTSVTSWPI